MIHPAIALIEARVSTNHFDPAHNLMDDEIRHLVSLATRAPTSFNFQNWRFVAVRERFAKMRLRDLAYGQVKVAEAAVTFIVCGQRPDAEHLVERLKPFVETSLMTQQMAAQWQESARAKYADPTAARDEAIRSAALGAATLIFAAAAMGLASGPMGGFDAEAVSHEFGLAADEVPVMLVPVGRAAPGNWPQKPRRPLCEVLQIV